MVSNWEGEVVTEVKTLQVTSTLSSCCWIVVGAISRAIFQSSAWQGAMSTSLLGAVKSTHFKRIEIPLHGILIDTFCATAVVTGQDQIRFRPVNERVDLAAKLTATTGLSYIHGVSPVLWWSWTKSYSQSFLSRLSSCIALQYQSIAV